MEFNPINLLANASSSGRLRTTSIAATTAWVVLPNPGPPSNKSPTPLTPMLPMLLITCPLTMSSTQEETSPGNEPTFSVMSLGSKPINLRGMLDVRSNQCFFNGDKELMSYIVYITPEFFKL